MMDSHHFRALAQEVAALAKSTDKAWRKAVLDVRFSQDRTAWCKKIDVFVEQDRKVSGKMMGWNFDNLLLDLTGTPAPDRYYGVLLAVDRSGSVDVKLDYDPACFDDPTFYD